MKKRILIVDDDIQILGLVEEVLNEYEVTTVTDGKQAIKKMLTEQFDLVILDQNMPYYKGTEVIAEAKRYNIDVPIFLHTSDAQSMTYEPTYSKGSEKMFKDIKTLLED